MKKAVYNLKSDSRDSLKKTRTVKKRTNKNIKKVSDDANMVSFLRVTEKVMGFRECAKLVSIAKATKTLIKLISGKKSGNTESILSLTTMGLSAGSPIVLEIESQGKDSDKHSAFHSAIEVITKGCSDPE